MKFTQHNQYNTEKKVINWNSKIQLLLLVYSKITWSCNMISTRLNAIELRHTLWSSHGVFVPCLYIARLTVRFTAWWYKVCHIDVRCPLCYYFEAFSISTCEPEWILLPLWLDKPLSYKILHAYERHLPSRNTWCVACTTWELHYRAGKGQCGQII